MAFVINGLWGAWIVYWYVAAVGTKPVRRRESPASRLSHILPLVLAVALLIRPGIAGPALEAPIIPYRPGFSVIGAVLVAAGLGFAVWARIHLAGNWSGTVTLKQDHELVRNGPYTLVRHPIYAGLLLAVTGTVVANDRWSGLVALALVAAAFLRKIAIEERFMAEAFGPAYADYRRATARLVPYLW
ncbi:isoprenylcysteine carboxylmethyltransferase family protein [Mycobacterium sp. KBS0706]|uniref:methyltransferase family protein n=1 Tax=Mycobacterium sp. KBS0706 TaxID=2578109 RepID=UPI00163D9739|nr:isoprenylcysteine carboxylmethyltransferase family protein [Mycobacterium sp. KBS0706]